MKTNQILQGNTSDILKTLPPESVNCCVTSPPYWGLRDYGTAKWRGGDPKCDHVANPKATKKFGNPEFNINRPSREETKTAGYYKEICPKCGAKKIDQQLGLEPTFQEYITKLCDIFDKIKRVLRNDGTIWVNLGDTYGGSGGSHTGEHKNDLGFQGKYRRTAQRNIMPSKCLLQIPARFSIEMCNRGWILRNVIIWQKPNCMPSSVRDRFTVDFEYFFFFTKSKKYYFEQQFEGFAESTLAGNPTRNRKHGSAFVDGTPGRSKQNGGKIVMPNKKGRNKRCTWTITTKPYKEAHFACVSADTEILTIDGWKKYNEIKRYTSSPHHVLVATYNLEKQIIEYQRLSYIKKYNCAEKIFRVGNRDLNILLTGNHRNIVIKKKSKKEKIEVTTNLAYGDKIRVCAPIVYPENNGIGETLAELVGWIISEGHYKKGGWIEIYQNEGNKAKRIDYLLNKLEIPHTRNIRHRNYKGQDRVQVNWFLKKSPLVEWCLLNIPNKKLNKFLISLPIKEANALFSGLISGDGHIRKDDGRISFAQKDKTMKDWFQILALRLGYHSVQSKDVHLTRRTHIGIRHTNGKGKSIEAIKYYGKVWCPKTPNGTWVARRNGRIFITGNTFPEKLIETPIKAGCPEFVCKKCGKAREKIFNIKSRYTKREPAHASNNTPTKVDSSGWKHPIITDKGYTKCECNVGFDGGIVLDPFIGSGTTAVVAKKLNRNWLGIELNPDYIKLAEKRIANVEKTMF